VVGGDDSDCQVVAGSEKAVAGSEKASGTEAEKPDGQRKASSSPIKKAVDTPPGRRIVKVQGGGTMQSKDKVCFYCLQSFFRSCELLCARACNLAILMPRFNVIPQLFPR
jgi:hypothetical protein